MQKRWSVRLLSNGKWRTHIQYALKAWVQCIRHSEAAVPATLHTSMSAVRALISLASCSRPNQLNGTDQLSLSTVIRPHQRWPQSHSFVGDQKCGESCWGEWHSRVYAYEFKLWECCWRTQHKDSSLVVVHLAERVPVLPQGFYWMSFDFLTIEKPYLSLSEMFESLNEALQATLQSQ